MGNKRILPGKTGKRKTMSETVARRTQKSKAAPVVGPLVGTPTRNLSDQAFKAARQFRGMITVPGPKAKRANVRRRSAIRKAFITYYGVE